MTEETRMTKEFERALMPDKPDLQFGYALSANPYGAELTRIGSFRAFLQAKYGAQFVVSFRQMMERGAVPEYPGRDAVWCDYRFQYGSVSIERIEFYCKSQYEVFADFILSAGVSRLDRGSWQLLERRNERFRMRCVLALGQEALSCTEILGINVYRKLERPPGRQLDDYLVPVAGLEDLEDISKEMLLRYQPEALRKAGCVVGKKLAASMGYPVVLVALPDGSDVRSQFYFESHVITLKSRNGETLRRRMRENTILVNVTECLGDDGQISEDRVNEAIVHECFHAYRHRLFYLGQRFYNKNFHYLSCNLAGQTASAEFSVQLAQAVSFQLEQAAEAENAISLRGPLDWIEWQANRATPRIRMPRDTFLPKTERLLSQNSHLPEPEQYTKTICALAGIYGVSKQSAKIRMIELGFDQAQGVLNYANGGYVEDYSVGDASLKKNETYTVEYADALRLFATSEKFRKTLQNGQYQYADGHFCQVDRRYLVRRNGELHLTAYAKTHMHECCLVFRRVRRRPQNEYREGVLHKRDVENPYVLNYARANEGANLRDASQSLSRLVQSLPPRADATLRALMTQRRVTIELLAERSGVSPRTINRLRSSGCRPEKQTVLAICFGLRLEPMLSFDLLRKFGIFLSDSPEDIAYQFALIGMYSKPLSEVNEVLAGSGVPLLGDPEMICE